MVEIRFHGRGGQGAVVAARILASAFAKEQKDVLVIPEFKSERRSAPVAASPRVDETKILLRSKVYNPDIVVILDESLLSAPDAQVMSGLKENGLVVLNCANPNIIEELGGFKVGFSDADAVARHYKLGPSSLPAVGTAMLGAFAKSAGLVRLESILEAARESEDLPKKEENLRAIKEVYDATLISQVPAKEKSGGLQESQEIALKGFKELPISVISLVSTSQTNKTGSWRRIRPEHSPASQTISTCMIACPIHQDIREWMLALRSGHVKEAAKILLRHNPLASAVSRVCPIFCERGCRHFREGFDEPLAISAVERFLGGWAIEHHFRVRPPDIKKKERVAIVGSGPAGLTCAYALRKKGYFVTIFERLPKPGGLLTWGIPEDRLPKDIVLAEIALHLNGVDIQTNVEIARDNWKALTRDYRAVLFANGYSADRKLKIPGEEHHLVISALKFLGKINSGLKWDLRGKKAIIIGGGNTAMDAARVARDLGAQVKIVYRRTEAAMRAFDEEIELTKARGVEWKFLSSPVEIQEIDGQTLKIVFEGRDKDKFEEKANLVITAIGQVPEWSLLPLAVEEGLSRRDLSLIEADGLFVAGDLLSGPKTVARAIANGNIAAKKIMAYLAGQKYSKGQIRRQVKRQDINFAYFRHHPRTSDVQKESQRCFICGFCDRCGNCWIYCPDMAVSETKEGLAINYDFCKGCQICHQECPQNVIVTRFEKEGKNV